MWLKGDGKFDTHSYYHAIHGSLYFLFPWKGVWKPKIPKRVAFFLWTAAHNRILMLDNLMIRGRPLINRCCMCCCYTYLMDSYASGFWYPLGYARIGGKHNSNIWNLILGCLMWIVWMERNHCSFENMEKTLDELKVSCQCSLFEWSRC